MASSLSSTTRAKHFNSDARRISDLILRTTPSPSELASTLTLIERALERMDLPYANSPSKATEVLFRLNLLFRKQLQVWSKADLITAASERQIRHIFGMIRYRIDMLIEFSLGERSLGPSQGGKRAFAPGVETSVNTDDFKTPNSRAFRSGDILLVRGSLYHSAAIARMLASKSQFAHAMMIYIDDETNQQWAIDAVVDTGTRIRPLNFSLCEGLVRAIHLRHPDSKLAKTAARLLFNRISSHHQRVGQPIPFDYSLEMDRTGDVFCTKLIHAAFKEASAGNVSLPSFPSHLDMKNRDFVDWAGISTRRTFAPADLELEPQLDVVAEWRDPEAIHNVRLQDALMDRIHSWMENYGYRFVPDTRTRIKCLAAGCLAGIPHNTKARLKPWLPVVPRNMRSSTVAIFFMLRQTAHPLAQKLQKHARIKLKQAQTPIGPDEIGELLERLRRRTPLRIGNLQLPVQVRRMHTTAAEQQAAFHRNT